MITRREFLRFAAIFGIPTVNVRRYVSEILLITNPASFINVNFKIWLIRPDNLLDLEFGFVNLKRRHGDKMHVDPVAAGDAFMIVRLPQMHIAEHNFPPDPVAANTVAQSFLAGNSYLVFKFNPVTLATFTLVPDKLLDWKSEKYFSLCLLDPADYKNTHADFTAANPNYGLAANGNKPVTTFQAPYGVSIAPLGASGKTKYRGSFVKDNEIDNSPGYVFPKGDEMDTAQGYYNATGLGKAVDKNADMARKGPPYNEIWFNDLVYKDSKDKLLFKVIDIDTKSNADQLLLPTLADKTQYLAQFRENDSQNDQQLIRLVSEQFRLSPLGLSASLNYVSPDPEANLQKIYQEIVYGRDQYVEVQRLGYMYPLGIRVVQISIGRRVIKNGISYIEQRQYIAPLDKSVVYRDESEQSAAGNPDSVLQKITGAGATDVNYINSCKRSFPFQRIDILTHDYIEILEPENLTGHDKVTSGDGKELLGYWPQLRSPGTAVDPVLEFQFSALDWGGNTVVFESPFIFVDALHVKNVTKQYTDKNAALQALQTAGAKVDEALICLQQELLADKVKVMNILSGAATGLDKKLKDLSGKLYKRYDQLINSLATTAEDIETRYKSLNALIQPDQDPDSFYAALEKYLTGVSNPPDDPALKTHMECLAVYVFALQKAKLGSYNSVKDSLNARINATQQKIEDIENALDKTKKQLYYATVKKFYELDKQLSLNYHQKENDVRREIALKNQKIAYYNAIVDNAVADAEQKVNELETAVIAFSAIPLTKIAEFKAKTAQLAADAQGNIDAGLLKLRNFGSQHFSTYPQLLAAQVKLPVIDQLMNDTRAAANTTLAKGAALQQKYADTRLAVIAYADAYRVAGLEGWQAGEADIKKNAGRILFDVQEALMPAEAATVLDAARNAYEKDIKAPWQSLSAKTQDFEAGTVGFAKSKITGIFADAAAKVGGVVNPGLVIEHISAIKDKIYALKNDIDPYTGEIRSYLKNGADDARKVAATIQDYEGQLKNAVVDADYLNKLLKDVQLFGFKLTDLLNNTVTYSPELLPKSTITVNKQSGLVAGSVIAYDWHSPKENKMLADGSGAIKFLNGGKPGDHSNAFLDLSVNNTMSFELLPAVVTNKLDSSVGLNNFAVSALDIITIYFKELSYAKSITSKRDATGAWTTSTSSAIHLQIAQVEFSGFLSLIKQLEEALGIGDNFLLDVGVDGMSISYGISIPNISTGGFTMSNMNLYAGLVLSFKDAPPSVRFAFSDRANPFTLAAGIYGGRGFFALYVSQKGIERMEASLEFGGYFALDIAGIAKGQAYLMAGIYFRNGRGESAYAEGYITCGGSLSIIGLIHISVVFYLGMSYQSGELHGFASVEVSVSIMFFSASYNLTFERRVTGSSGLSYNRQKNRTGGAYEYLAADFASEKEYLDEVFGAGSPPAGDRAKNASCFLFIEDRLGQWKDEGADNLDDGPKLIPIYDPTLLYEEDMDFELYVKQFSN